MSACPCQSGLAASPEALMRSRFSAFALKNTDYIARSWHLSQRPVGLDLDDDQQWLALEIIASGEEGDTGWVHFCATSKDRQGLSALEERSRFVRENGHWYYLDGTPSVSALKRGRNDPCPCGSGKKFKKCCG